MLKDKLLPSFWSILLFGLLCYLMLQAYFQGNLTKDSMQYIEFAQSLDFSEMPKHFGIWPPLYPLSLKLVYLCLLPLNALGFSEISLWIISSKLLNFIVFILLAKLLKKELGNAFSLFILCSPAILLIYRFTWSEGLFILWLLLFTRQWISLVEYQISLSQSNPEASTVQSNQGQSIPQAPPLTRLQLSASWIKLLGFAYLCFMTRYIGLFLIGPILLLAGFYLWMPTRPNGLAQEIRNTLDQLRLPILLSILSYLLAVIGYLVLNLKLSGHFLGTQRGANELGQGDLFFTLIKAGVKEYLIYLPLALMLFPSIKKAPTLKQWLSQHITAISLFCLGFCYLTALYLMRLLSHFDLFSTRLVYPGILLTLWALALILKKERLPYQRATYGISWLILLALGWHYEARPLLQELMANQPAFMSIKDPCQQLSISQKLKTSIINQRILANPPLFKLKGIGSYAAYFEAICYPHRVDILYAPYHQQDKALDVFQRYRYESGFYIDFLEYQAFDEYWHSFSDESHRYDPSIKALLHSHFQAKQLVWVENPLLIKK